ncbi:MAG: imidazole glycerol phosphate synthase subunit HisH [Alphaproteobacteria bacterium]|nr:imidazole glycerol phosphate synthase subunit HisH [Alphaproteobacteria bacterium]
MIGIVNYGIGNLRSVANALEQVGARFALIGSPAEVAGADKLLVPGVGAFGACMEALTTRGFREPVLAHAAAGKPLLGICVGMQMLATLGTEFGERPGLGLVPGRVVQIPRTTPELRLPQIGWNALRLRGDCALLRGLGADTSAYFVHSFHLVPDDPADVAADVDYGGPVIASVARANVFGMQFHPEKSQGVGLKVLENFWTL